MEKIQVLGEKELSSVAGGAMMAYLKIKGQKTGAVAETIVLGESDLSLVSGGETTNIDFRMANIKHPDLQK
jgi:hypothetical protein